MSRELDRVVEELYRIPKFTSKNSPEHTREFLRELGDPQEDFAVIHVAGSNGKGSVCAFFGEMLSGMKRVRTVNVKETSASKACAQTAGSEGSGKVGLFLSPHLVDIRERFLIDGELCSEPAFLSAYQTVREAIERITVRGLPHPTFFEILFAVGMVIFSRENVEIAVLETGLGGRLDATNIVRRPLLCVITSISLEHTQYLGTTIKEIAGEKAGILKPGVPVVYDASDPQAAAVICERAEELGCPAVGVKKACDPDKTEYSAKRAPCDAENETCEMENGMREAGNREKTFSNENRTWRIQKFNRKDIDFSLYPAYDKKTDWNIPFVSEHQVQNASLAITGMEILDSRRKRDPNDLQTALTRARWPGRMEEILPDIWLDGAHNPAGIREFTKTVNRICRDDAQKPILLFSMVSDKDYQSAVRALTEEGSFCKIILTSIRDERGLSPEKLKDAFLVVRESSGGKSGHLGKDHSYVHQMRESSGGEPGDPPEESVILRWEDGTPQRKERKRQISGFLPELVCIEDAAEALNYGIAQKQDNQKLFACGSLYFIGELESRLKPR